MGFPGGSHGKESTCNAGDLGLIPGWEDLPEEGMGTDSSILAWRSPWTEEPGELYSPWGCKELDMTEQLSTAQNTSVLIKMYIGLFWLKTSVAFFYKSVIMVFIHVC